MGQLVKKKRPAHVLTPGQMLQTLQQEPQMTALLQHKAIWLAVTPRTAWILDACCTGQMEGGPGTAQDTANTLGLVLPPVDATPQQHAQVPEALQPSIPLPAKRPRPDTEASIACVAGSAAGSSIVLDPPSEQQHAGAIPEQQQQAGAISEQQQQAGAISEQQQQARAISEQQQQAGASSDQQLQSEATLDQREQAQAAGEQAGQQQCTPLEGLLPGGNTGVTVSSGSITQQPAIGTHEPDEQQRIEASTAQLQYATQASTQTEQAVEKKDVEQPAAYRQNRSRRRSSKPEAPAPWAAMPHQWISVRFTLEEAFFLQHVLRCLVVKTAADNADGQPAGAAGHSTAAHTAPSAADLVSLDDQALWTACRAVRPNFPTSYVGYHHLKCKGWLPRSGLLYGVDYVVYSLHPAAMHSHFAVLLQPLHAGTPAPIPPSDSSQAHSAEPPPLAASHVGQQPSGQAHGPKPAGTYDMHWHDLQITARVVSTVSKKLLLLYLYQLPSSPGHDTPACLEHYRVEERFVRRWVSDATRD